MSIMYDVCVCVCVFVCVWGGGVVSLHTPAQNRTKLLTFAQAHHFISPSPLPHSQQQDLVSLVAEQTNPTILWEKYAINTESHSRVWNNSFTRTGEEKRKKIQKHFQTNILHGRAVTGCEGCIAQGCAPTAHFVLELAHVH